MCASYVSKSASINPLYAIHSISSVDTEYDEKPSVFNSQDI